MPNSAPAILLVEDAFELREALEEVLRLEGYAVQAAADGRQALSTLEAGFRPCVILLDFEMPVMDGFEFRRHQTANPHFAAIPLIAHSGAYSVEKKADEIGAAAFIRKPANMEYLLALLQQHRLK